MKLATASTRAARRAGFTLLEVLVVVAILVILAGVGVVATTRYLENARKSQAQLQCRSLASACETYYLDPRSGGTYPASLNELVNFPGGSLLKNGYDDLKSPWGTNNPYVLQQTTSSEGSTIIFVYVDAPDGTRITQHGIGQGFNKMQ